MAEYLKPSAKQVNGEALTKEGKRWIERINASWADEKTWVDDAEKAVSAYTGEGTGGTAVKYDFNILFANVETIVPAIINSPPQPDIRGRFADDDPVAKDVAEIMERTIRVQVDDSRLQIELEGGAQDSFLAGRGLVRLRFLADVEGGEDEDELRDLAEEVSDDHGHGDARRDEVRLSARDRDDADDDADNRDAADGASVKNERITFEAVSWRDYRHGPAKRWDQRPWEAYRHSIPMEDMEGFSDQALVAAQTSAEDKLAVGDTDNDVVIWEVWDRKTHKVKFIAEDTGRIVKVVDDPLGLDDFYPCCTPMQPIELVGRLKPVNPFSIYRKLADELDVATKRIVLITKAMKVRGWYPGDAGDLAALLNADDSDFVPIANAEIWAANGGLAGAVAFWPIEKFIQVLQQLYVSRDQTKQAIYEITGISDIVRGASKAAETLGAQQIKAQWGSLRIQKMQRMMERAARDLFVKMAQIISTKFSPETLEKITGIQLLPKPQEQQPLPPPPKPPIAQNTPPDQAQQMQQQYEQAVAQYQQAEQGRQKKLAHMDAVNKLLNDGLGRMYRVDVESDSTVRADLTQKKQEQAEFLQGTAAYFAAVAPMVESGTMTREGALTLYAATARLFTLGKSTEDALDREIAQAKERASQTQPEKPDPEMVKAELEAKKQEALGQIAMAAAQREDAKTTALIGKLTAETDAKKIESQTSIAETNAKLEQDRMTHAQEMQTGQQEILKLQAEIARINAGTEATRAKTQETVMAAAANAAMASVTPETVIAQ